MKIKNLAVGFALSAVAFAAQASAVTWTDWSNTSAGTLTFGSSTVNVALAGNPWDLVNGDFYYNNGSTGGTSVSGTYAGLAPSDLIRVYNAGQYTISFDKEVVDPYIALVSVGQGGLGVTYSFDSAFSVVSAGGNYWGYSGYTTSGNNFTGYEYNGILKFTGTYTSLSFTIQNPEYWHGFNVGAATAAPVPEPEMYLSLLAGLGALGFVARRRKSA